MDPRKEKYLSINFNYFPDSPVRYGYYLCDDIGIVRALSRDQTKKYLQHKKLRPEKIFRHHPYQVIRAYLLTENKS